MKKILFILCVAGLWACVREPADTWTEPKPKYEGPNAVVNFTLGSDAVQNTRAAFDEARDTVMVLVFQREADQTGPAISSTPFKTAKGKLVADGDKSTIVLLSGDIEPTGELTVPVGSAYDFAVVVNSANYKLDVNQSLFGNPVSSGMIGGFTNGMDVLAGRKDGVPVTEQTEKVDVTFTEFGANEGNLPHLSAAIRLEASMSEDMRDVLFNQTYAGLGLTELDYRTVGIDFISCVAASARLDLTGETPVLASVASSGEYKASWSEKLASQTRAVTGATTEANTVITSGEGFMLPFPVSNPTLKYNVHDINFRIEVKGAPIDMTARGVKLPAFEAGKRYTFRTRFHRDPLTATDAISLTLVIEDWNKLSWQSGMGQVGEPTQAIVLPIGTWTNVSWNNVMGGEEKAFLSVSAANFTARDWYSEMGGILAPKKVAPYLLYWDEVSSTLAAGRWSGTGTVTEDVEDGGVVDAANMLYFKAGGVIGVNRAGEVKFDPTENSLLTYASIPYYAGSVNAVGYISSGAYHNGSSVKDGYGDPCRLVGLSANANAQLVREHNSGLRLPTVAEWKLLLGMGTANTIANSTAPYWSVVSGQNGGWFPVADGSVNTAAGSFIPAAGYRDATTLSTTTTYYLSSDVVSGVVQGLSITNNNVTPAQLNFVSERSFAVRCVPVEM